MYLKLESAIGVTKDSAAGYFAAQQAITERINDPGTARLKAQEDDERDLDLYRQWEQRADAVLEEAHVIALGLPPRHGSQARESWSLEPISPLIRTSFSEVPAAIADLNRVTGRLPSSQGLARPSGRLPNRPDAQE